MATAASSPSATPPPAELFLRVSLFLLLATSVATLVSTGKLDLLAVILAPAAILYKGVRWWRRCPAEIVPRAATWLVLGYVFFFPFDVFFFSRAFVASSSNPALYAALLGAIHFVLYVMIVRLYSATTDRDALFLAMLSFGAILASAVLTVDTTFLVLFFLFLLFGVGTFVGLEMRRGAKGAVGPAFAAQSHQERRLTRALSLAAVTVSFGAILMGGALFFFFPRVNAGFLGRTGMQPSLMTGFSDDVELGQIGEIKKNSAVVMRIKTGKPVAYPRLRWRGIALSAFDGKRWYSPNHDASAIPPSANGWIHIAGAPPKPESTSVGLRYTVFLQPLATDTIFGPADIIAVRGNFSGEGSNQDAAARRSFLLRDSTDSLANPFHNYSSIRYEGMSMLPAEDPVKLRGASTEYPAEIRETYLQLPPALDRRIPDFAREITARARTPYDKAITIESYLQTRFRYTLNLTGKPGDDPLAHFLFETRAGHCEYFSSAMAIMLRTLDIPSREVNGFLPGEYNDLGDDYIVRASDAHSWVEVYFSGSGWRTFDPTPASADIAVGLFSRLGEYLDWLELSWNEWVINYDFSHQVLLAQSLQRGSRNWTESARAWFEKENARGKKWIRSWQAEHNALRFLLPLALLLFLVILRFEWLGRVIHRLWLSWRLRTADPARSNPGLASQLYLELLRLLSRHGFARRDSETPLEFAAAVTQSGLAPAVREFTQLYTRARFGDAPCDMPRLREILNQVRSALRRQ